jgi:hypothetical protein
MFRAIIALGEHSARASPAPHGPLRPASSVPTAPSTLPPRFLGYRFIDLRREMGASAVSAELSPLDENIVGGYPSSGRMDSPSSVSELSSGMPLKELLIEGNRYCRRFSHAKDARR